MNAWSPGCANQEARSREGARLERTPGWSEGKCLPALSCCRGRCLQAGYCPLIPVFPPTGEGSPRQGNPGSALVLRGKYWYQPDTHHRCKRQAFLEALARESAGEKERHSSGRPSGPGFIGRAVCHELGRAEISPIPRGTSVDRKCLEPQCLAIPKIRNHVFPSRCRRRFRGFSESRWIGAWHIPVLDKKRTRNLAS